MRLLLFAISIALVTAGCFGSDSDGTDDAMSDDEVSSDEPAPSPEPAPGDEGAADEPAPDSSGGSGSGGSSSSGTGGGSSGSSGGSGTSSSPVKRAQLVLASGLAMPFQTATSAPAKLGGDEWTIVRSFDGGSLQLAALLVAPAEALTIQWPDRSVTLEAVQAIGWNVTHDGNEVWRFHSTV